MWGVTSLSRTQGVSGWVGTCYVGVTSLSRTQSKVVCRHNYAIKGIVLGLAGILELSIEALLLLSWGLFIVTISATVKPPLSGQRKFRQCP